MGVLVDRRRVLQRIRRSAVPLIALIAPAGYGKSYIAHRIAREDPHWATIDANITNDARAFEQALAAIPILAPHAHGGVTGLTEGWGACPEPITLILDNLENVIDPEMLDIVAGLVLSRPVQGKLILCARRSLPLRLSDFASPHLVATVRSDDLRFDGTEMAQLFAETRFDETALFRASRFTEGWPVVALYLQRHVQEG